MTVAEQVREHFAGKPAFTAREVRLFLSGKGVGKGYADLLLHNLLKRGLRRIAAGVYTFREEMQLVGFAFQPCYYGLQDALSLRNASEQETNPVVVTPRRVRVGVRRFLGNNYVVKRISRKMFFGFEPVKYGDFWVNASDLEKTLIDFVYFRQPLSDETLAELAPRLDRVKLSGYLLKCSARVRKRVEKLLEGRG